MTVELTYTDKNKVEQGVITAFTCDFAYGADENNFEITVEEDFELEEGCYVYFDGTEFGGIVRGWQYSTVGDTHVRKYTGDSWQGMLSKKIICPDANQDYYKITSKKLNEAIHILLARYDLDHVFDVGAYTGKTITFQFDRYIDLYEGIHDMLTANGMRLALKKESGEKPVLSAETPKKYVDDGSTHGLSYEIEYSRPVNHLICLGKGELKERDVVHLFANNEGKISTTQTLFGLDEVVETYDYSNAEHNELINAGKKKLKEMQASAYSGSLELPENLMFEVGDIVGIHDDDTGYSVEAAVTKNIMKVAANGYETFTSEIGEVTAGSKTYGNLYWLDSEQANGDVLHVEQIAGSASDDVLKLELGATVVGGRLKLRSRS